jgi:hypothetical protein
MIASLEAGRKECGKISGRNRLEKAISTRQFAGSRAFLSRGQ